MPVVRDGTATLRPTIHTFSRAALLLPAAAAAATGRVDLARHPGMRPPAGRQPAPRQRKKMDMRQEVRDGCYGTPSLLLPAGPAKCARTCAAQLALAKIHCAHTLARQGDGNKQAEGRRARSTEAHAWQLAGQAPKLAPDRAADRLRRGLLAVASWETRRDPGPSYEQPRANTRQGGRVGAKSGG
jgi:hypothetical protein